MAACLQPETEVALELVVARGRRRLRGLIAQPPPPPGSGLLIERCRLVHGCFMAYAIDVAFVDRGFRVLATGRLRPWRLLGCRGAAHTIELRAGECGRLAIVPGKIISQRGGELAALDP